MQQHILTQSDAIFDAIILVDCKEMMEYGDCLHLHMQYIDRKTQGFTLSFKSGNDSDDESPYSLDFLRIGSFRGNDLQPPNI